MRTYSKVLFQHTTSKYIGEMETRFNKGDWDGFWQFRGQRRPIGIFHGGTFLTAFSRRSFWWYSRRHRTPLQIMANFGGESFQLLNPGTTSCIFCGECLISCEGPIRFKNKIHQIDRILKAVKNVPPWKIPIGRLCPRNCQKKHLSLLYKSSLHFTNILLLALSTLDRSYRSQRYALLYQVTGTMVRSECWCSTNSPHDSIHTLFLLLCSTRLHGTRHPSTELSETLLFTSRIQAG